MELFSKWSRVEKADGTVVILDQFLEVVWDTVASEALRLIEPEQLHDSLGTDARFTLMALWTLRQSGIAEEGLDSESLTPALKPSSSLLPYDTASLLARGIGANLAELDATSLVAFEEKGTDKMVALLSPDSRRQWLLGAHGRQKATPEPGGSIQLRVGETPQVAKQRQTEESDSRHAKMTVIERASPIDKIHQCMLAHADGATASLDFLIQERIGDDRTTWQLAQTLNSLYPEGSWERNKIEGVLARYHSLFGGRK